MLIRQSNGKAALKPGRIMKAVQYDSSAGGLLDQDGESTRTLYPLQYIETAANLDLNGSIVGDETVTSKQGTASVTVAVGKLTVGVGTLWTWTLSNGSTYEFGTILTATTGICFDTSDNGRNLTFTVADTSAICKSGREKGSDCYNLEGFTDRVENQYIRSENLLNAVWGKAGCSLFYNPTIGPFGATSEYQLKENSSNSGHYILQQLQKFNTFYLVSIHAKPDTARYVQIMSHASGTQYVNFDVLDGVVTAHGSGVSVYGVIPAQDGWYRCYAVVQSSGDGSISYRMLKTGFEGWAASTQGDGVSSLWVDYMQAELYLSQSSPTPYYTTELSRLDGGVKPSVLGIEKVSPVSRTTILLSVEGDSRANETSPSNIFWHSYISEYITSQNPVVIINSAIGGDSLYNMNSGNNYLNSLTPMAPTGKCGFFILYAGVNDIMSNGRTGAQCYAYASGLWAKARSDGYIVVASTEAGSAGMNAAQLTERDAFNSLVRSDSSKYDILIEPDIYVPTSTPAYYIDGTHLTDIEGARAFASMVAAAINNKIEQTIENGDLQYRLKDRSKQYQRKAKYNLTRISGTSSTIADADTYSFADAHAVRTALGWTYGVDHWAFSSVGVPKVISGATIAANANTGGLFFNPDKPERGVVVYSDSSGPIKAALGIDA